MFIIFNKNFVGGLVFITGKTSFKEENAIFVIPNTIILIGKYIFNVALVLVKRHRNLIIHCKGPHSRRINISRKEYHIIGAFFVAREFSGLVPQVKVRNKVVLS